MMDWARKLAITHVVMVGDPETYRKDLDRLAADFRKVHKRAVRECIRMGKLQVEARGKGLR